MASAVQLASDQAAIDVAQAQLTTAQQNLADATMTSPITGTVASVSITPGATVSAGSNSGTAASAAIVVLGPGSYQVTTDVAVTQLPSVTVGQKALVTPDATGTPVTGTVASIGLVPTSSSTTTSYPVTVSVAGGAGLKLLSGADADISIVTRQAVGVTAVPTSAVRTVGTNHLVSELHDGTLTSVRVGIGTVGDLLTQVTSGIQPGTQVVLANLAQPLPSANTTTAGRTGRTGLGAAGGLGGAGFGGGAGPGGAGFGAGGGSFGGGGGGRFGGAGG